MKTKHLLSRTTLFASAIALLLLGCNCPKKGNETSCQTGKTECHHAKIETADEALSELLAGNKRFLAGKQENTNFKEQIEATKGAQHPYALVLTCLDSRVPPEIIFDQGIGNIFVARVAGNIEDANMIGSMEFATKFKHTKLIVILGHSHCGAIEGAIADAKLGQLTNLLDQIKPAIVGDTTNKEQMVELTSHKNITNTISDILAGSEILSEQVKAGEVKIVGAYYNIETGEVTLL